MKPLRPRSTNATPEVPPRFRGIETSSSATDEILCRTRPDIPPQTPARCLARVRPIRLEGRVICWSVQRQCSCVTLGLVSLCTLVCLLCSLRTARAADWQTSVGPTPTLMESRSFRSPTQVGAELFHCAYNAGTITYSLEGGTSGTTYSVVGTTTGAVDLGAAPGDLVGPRDTKSVAVSCRSAGTGTVTLRFFKATTELGSCSFTFQCNSLGGVPMLSGPAASVGGLVAVTVAMVATLWYHTQRHRRRRSSIGSR